MSVKKVQNFCAASFCCGPYIDEEEKRIMRKLMQYGITPTGRKSTDKVKLHEIEIKQAQMENCVTSKFLTVTRQEQEKIQTKKKEKRVENNPELYQNSTKGQKILGEQIYLAIKMKNHNVK